MRQSFIDHNTKHMRPHDTKEEKEIVKKHPGHNHAVEELEHVKPDAVASAPDPAPVALPAPWDPPVYSAPPASRSEFLASGAGAAPAPAPAPAAWSPPAAPAAWSPPAPAVSDPPAPAFCSGCGASSCFWTNRGSAPAAVLPAVVIIPVLEWDQMRRSAAAMQEPVSPPPAMVPAPAMLSVVRPPAEGPPAMFSTPVPANPPAGAAPERHLEFPARLEQSLEPQAVRQQPVQNAYRPGNNMPNSAHEFYASALSELLDLKRSGAGPPQDLPGSPQQR